MTSKPATVAAYLAEVPEGRRAAIEKLHKLCRSTLKGYEECIEYGLPCYKRNGMAEVAFGSRSQYIALYVMKKDVVNEFRAELPAATGKGCIRFAKPEKMDFATIERLLRKTAASTEAAC